MELFSPNPSTAKDETEMQVLNVPVLTKETAQMSFGQMSLVQTVAKIREHVDSLAAETAPAKAGQIADEISGLLCKQQPQLARIESATRIPITKKLTEVVKHVAGAGVESIRNELMELSGLLKTAETALKLAERVRNGSLGQMSLVQAVATLREHVDSLTAETDPAKARQIADEISGLLSKQQPQLARIESATRIPIVEKLSEVVERVASAGAESILAGVESIRDKLMEFSGLLKTAEAALELAERVRNGKCSVADMQNAAAMLDEQFPGFGVTASGEKIMAELTAQIGAFEDELSAALEDTLPPGPFAGAVIGVGKSLLAVVRTNISSNETFEAREPDLNVDGAGDRLLKQCPEWERMLKAWRYIRGSDGSGGDTPRCSWTLLFLNIATIWLTIGYSMCLTPGNKLALPQTIKRDVRERVFRLLYALVCLAILKCAAFVRNNAALSECGALFEHLREHYDETAPLPDPLPETPNFCHATPSQIGKREKATSTTKCATIAREIRAKTRALYNSALYLSIFVACITSMHFFVNVYMNDPSFIYWLFHIVGFVCFVFFSIFSVRPWSLSPMMSSSNAVRYPLPMMAPSGVVTHRATRGWRSSSPSRRS